MGETTHISWADNSWNPWIGCTKVSVGAKGACEGCYAEVWGKRFGVEWGHHDRRLTKESNWNDIGRWNAKAQRTGQIPYVFVASLADIWDNQVPIEWLTAAINRCRAAPDLQFLFLTKRPQNIVRRYLESQGVTYEATNYEAMTGAFKAFPRNIALGCTVVTNAEKRRDIPHLKKAGELLHPTFLFLSMEPLQEDVDLREKGADGRTYINQIDWVLAGGETDQGSHKARPIGAAPFRSLRDQCAWDYTVFHMKQWGSWIPHDQVVDMLNDLGRGTVSDISNLECDVVTGSERWGKKLTGRLLDGVLHDGRPERRCVQCGCTQDRACTPPCYWESAVVCSSPACVAASAVWRRPGPLMYPSVAAPAGLSA